jgi:ring-1,2-phenylacetyl-CoA epoxidase subunit PaaC
METLWMYTGELFRPAPYESALETAGVSVAVDLLEEPWMGHIRKVFAQANLQMPIAPAFQAGGKTGAHSEHLGFILAELQFMQRAYPGSTW